MNPYAAPAPGPFPAASPYGPAAGGARLEGDVLVVAKDAQLPDVCIKCGTHDAIVRRSTKLQWTPMWARMLVVFCTMPGLIAMLITTKRAHLHLPLCASCNARWSQAIGATIAAVVAIVLSFFMFRVVDDTPALGLVSVLAAFAFLVGVLVAMVKPRTLQVDKIDDREVRLKGFHVAAAEEMARGGGIV